MFWRVAHDTLKWVGISFFPAIAAVVFGSGGIAQGFPETKPWFVSRYEQAVEMMQTPLFWVCAFVAFVAWLAALVWSGHNAKTETERGAPNPGVVSAGANANIVAGDDQRHGIFNNAPLTHGHIVSSVNQTGGITAAEVHVHAQDTSLKGQFRDLLANIDPRILSEIDSGVFHLESRMTPSQLSALERLIAKPGSGKYFTGGEVTDRYSQCNFHDGIFGPTGGAELVKLSLRFAGGLRK